VGQSYVSLATFVAMLSILVTAVLAGYLLFVLIDPGVFGGLGGRGTATRVLVITVYVGAVAVLVRQTHRDLVPPAPLSGAGTPPPGAPAPPAPVAPAPMAPL
jgi:hypothetical protein